MVRLQASGATACPSARTQELVHERPIRGRRMAARILAPILTTPLALLIMSCSATDILTVNSSELSPVTETFPSYEFRVTVDESRAPVGLDVSLPGWSMSSKFFRSYQTDGTSIAGPAGRMGDVLGVRHAALPKVSYFLRVRPTHPSDLSNASGSEATGQTILAGRTRHPDLTTITQYPVDWDSTEPWANAYSIGQIAEITAPAIAQMVDSADASLALATKVLDDALANDTTGLPDPYLGPAPASLDAIDTRRPFLLEKLVANYSFASKSTVNEEDDPCVDQRENVQEGRELLVAAVLLGYVEMLAGPWGFALAYGQTLLAGRHLNTMVGQLERCKARNSGPGGYYEKRGSW